MALIRSSLVLVGVVAALLCGCLSDPPGKTNVRNDAGSDAGDAANQTPDARDDARNDADADASADSDAGDAATNACPTGMGCSRSGAPGVCNAFGACVECLREGDGHCAGAKPHCTTAYTCVECTQQSHCGLSEKCRNGACIERCGDGVVDADEDCEQGITGWSANNCNFGTCKRNVYENCRNDSTLCSQQVLCSAAFTCFEQSDNNCVTSCPTLPGFSIGCSQAFCYVDCTSGPCPRGTHCTRDVAIGSASVNMCFGD
jgi:hypothetical protein